MSVNTIDKSKGFTVVCFIVLVTGCKIGGFDKNSFAGVNEPTEILWSVNDEIEPDESYENLWILSFGVPSKLIGCAGGRTTRTGDCTYGVFQVSFGNGANLLSSSLCNALLEWFDGTHELKLPLNLASGTLTSF